MAKILLYSAEAREKLKKGIDKLADAVAVTLGPKGRNVVIEKSYGSPSITKDGVIIIKAQEFRSQEMNRGEALRRLKELVQSIAVLPVVRRPTRPTRSSQRKRMDSKARRGAIKSLRGRVSE